MKSEEFQRLKQLEKLYNEGVISVVDIWNTSQSFTTITRRELEELKKVLFTLEAKNYNYPAELPPSITQHIKLDPEKFDDRFRGMSKPAYDRYIMGIDNAKPEPFNTKYQQSPTAEEMSKKAILERLAKTPLFMGTNSTPSGFPNNIHEYDTKEARTIGEKMLARLRYVEIKNPIMEGRYFAKDKQYHVETLVFNQDSDGIYFTKAREEKTINVYRNEPKPDRVTPAEMDAILQIITEWKD